MIKQRKIKYKKNFNKRFHRNIHEFAVSRPQKKKKKILETLTGIAIGTVFSEIQCFSRSIRPKMFLKKRKTFAKFTGVKRWSWSLFSIKLQAEDQQPYLKETPTQIFFCVNCEIFKSTFL